MTKTNQTSATPYITEVKERFSKEAQKEFGDDYYNVRGWYENKLAQELQTAHEEGLEQGRSEERALITDIDYSLPQTTHTNVFEKKAFREGWVSAIKMIQSFLLSNKQTTTKKE